MKLNLKQYFICTLLLIFFQPTDIMSQERFDNIIPNNLGIQLKQDTEGVEHLDAVQNLGMKWVRRGFIWESIEKIKGVYDFSAYDKFVKNCEDRGLSIIGCMAFSNKLYGHVKDEPGRAGYAKFAAALVEHYKGRDIIWEIWNEPNTMTFWGRHGKVGNSDQYATEYTNLVKEVVPAMRKANPDCIILAGSVSNMWTESYKWMSYCFAKGILDVDWDIWSVHPYGLKSPEDYIEAYSHTRKLMNDAGHKVGRIWMNSERGFPIKEAEGYAGGDPKFAYEYQAWHFIRQYLIDILEGLPVTIWYEWGGTEGFAIYDGKKTYPAFSACKVFINELSGYKFDKRLLTKNDRDFVLRFTNSRGNVKLVAWAAPPRMEGPDKIVNHIISLPLENIKKKSLSFSDLYGKTSELKVVNDKIDIALSGSPIYIKLR